MDLNHRPRAYQARALNQLSYRPNIKLYTLKNIFQKLESLSKLNRIKTDEKGITPKNNLYLSP